MSEEFRRAVEKLSAPGDVREIRALKNGTTAAGYFDDAAALVREAGKLEEQGFTVYITANPAHPALLARAENKIKRSMRETTSDRDILRRRWLLIDCDPVRPAGVSATDDEKGAAMQRAREIWNYLRDEGWPEPLVGDSGNGAHLLCSIDLPNDPESLQLVRGVLEALSFKFSDGLVSVDTGMHNAARITKLYGTTARKGDSTEDRPHRASKLLKVPDERIEVSSEQLQAVAETKPEPPKQGRGGNKLAAREFDLAGWIEDHAVAVKREGPWPGSPGGHRWILEECAWAGHADNAAFIARLPSGAIAAGCHHDSCQGYGWRDLREHYEPDAYEYGGKDRYERNGHAGYPREGGYEDGSTPPRAPRGILLSEVKPERVRWSWKGRFARGKIAVVDGKPGLGKSAAMIDLAARVSVGKEWPDGSECEAGGVVICSAEDGLADTIRPRFDAAGGDPSKVVALSTVGDPEGGERMLAIPHDIPAIVEAIERVGAGLVIVDPLMAFLPGDVNSHRDQDVRRALAPLARMGESTGAAVVIVRHLNKAQGGDALYRGGGSIGIVGAARSGLLIAKHPEDDGRRVMASVKSNLAPPAPSLVFTLSEAENGAVRVDWKGESNLDASALLSAPTDHEERSTLTEAQNFLREILEDGSEGVADIKRQANEAGLSWRTVERAKAALGARAEREGESGKRGGGAWVWTLPAIKAATPKGWRPKPNEAHAEEENSAYISQKEGSLFRPPTSGGVKAANGVGGLKEPLSADMAGAEMQRANSGPAKALGTYLEKPTDERLKWLTCAVLAARGMDTGDWKRHAGAAREAAEEHENAALSLLRAGGDTT